MPATCRVSSDLITVQERRDLLADASSRRAQAKRCDRPRWRVVDGWQVLGPARFSYSPDGQLHKDIHPRVAERATELIEVKLRPVQSNYLYYDTGDYLGLHHDQARCPFAVIVLLDGDAGPLCVHPELQDARPEDLGALLEPDGHRGGQKIALQDGPLLLSGRLLPHHREPHVAAEPITLVTFCLGQEPAT
jgi:hypothetical protein